MAPIDKPDFDERQRRLRLDLASARAAATQVRLMLVGVRAKCERADAQAVLLEDLLTIEIRVLDLEEQLLNVAGDAINILGAVEGTVSSAAAVDGAPPRSNLH